MGFKLKVDEYDETHSWLSHSIALLNLTLKQKIRDGKKKVCLHCLISS